MAKHYSAYFKRSHKDFVNEGVFDGFPGKDAKLHVDPLLLKHCTTPEFSQSKVLYDEMSNMDMIVELLRPQLEHQTSYFSHQPSLGLYHHRDLIGSPSSFIKVI